MKTIHWVKCRLCKVCYSTFQDMSGEIIYGMSLFNNKSHIQNQANNELILITSIVCVSIELHQCSTPSITYTLRKTHCSTKCALKLRLVTFIKKKVFVIFAETVIISCYYYMRQIICEKTTFLCLPLVLLMAFARFHHAWRKTTNQSQEVSNALSITACELGSNCQTRQGWIANKQF